MIFSAGKYYSLPRLIFGTRKISEQILDYQLLTNNPTRTLDVTMSEFDISFGGNFIVVIINKASNESTEGGGGA